MIVDVIGCGPAGLAAAHAAIGLGADVVIYAPKAKTPQRGPLLMQRPIPGINTGHPDGTIHQVVIGGSILDYRYKLYGDINIGINGDMLVPQYFAWRHGETYDKLWNMYQHLVCDRRVRATELASMHERSDLVVSTANAESLCMRAHKFAYKAVEVTTAVSYPEQPENTLIFNAGQKPDWVRSSLVFGVGSTEWPVGKAPRGAHLIRKPISTDCDCFPHVLRTGRFGKWKNETWVDTAYWDTYNAVDSIMHKDERKKINAIAGFDGAVLLDMPVDR